MELYFIGPDGLPMLASSWDERSNIHWDWLYAMIGMRPDLIFFFVVPTTDLDAGSSFRHGAFRGGIIG